MAGKAMSLHLIVQAIYYDLIIQAAAYYREKYRSMRTPHCRVGLPEMLDPAFFVKQGAELSAFAFGLYPQAVIFYTVHIVYLSGQDFLFVKK
jgi:hypothetical protein